MDGSAQKPSKVHTSQVWVIMSRPSVFLRFRQPITSNRSENSNDPLADLTTRSFIEYIKYLLTIRTICALILVLGS
jgi:hypothetical protein